jgi:hypothetical protein
MQYKVKFVVFQSVVTALFPKVKADDRGNILSYAAIGQHGAASPTLIRCKRATPAEYADLLAELKGIYEPEDTLEII